MSAIDHEPDPEHDEGDPTCDCTDCVDDCPCGGCADMQRAADMRRPASPVPHPTTATTQGEQT